MVAAWLTGSLVLTPYNASTTRRGKTIGDIWEGTATRYTFTIPHRRHLFYAAFTTAHLKLYYDTPAFVRRVKIEKREI